MNSDIKGFFYPSSGSVYKIREKDKKIYKVYSDRKLEEEKLYKEICKNNNINLLIPRIFSSIGPYMNSPKNFQLGHSQDKQFMIIKLKFSAKLIMNILFAT